MKSWPLLRQLRDDPLGLGRAVRSERSATLAPRTKTADRVVSSICPYCAVGCGQRVYVQDERVTQRELLPFGAVRPAVLAPGLATGIRDQGQVPPAARHRMGGALAGSRDGDD